MCQVICSSLTRRGRRFALVCAIAATRLFTPTPAMGQALATSGPYSDAKPVIQALAPTQEFGVVTEGTKLRHSFKITNAGKAPLVIERVAPSCGCMTAEAYPNTLGPGQTGEFPITLDTQGLFGPFIKTVNIFSNDPTTPILTMTVHGESKRLIEIMPTSAGFGRISDDRTREQIVTLTNHSDQPMVCSMGSLKLAGNFEFELVETIPGYEYKVFVVMRQVSADGTYKGSAIINTNIPSQKTVEIPAMAIVLPRVEVQPGVLYIAEPSPTSPVSTKSSARAAEFINRGDTPIRVIEASVDDPQLRITTKEVEAGRLYRIMLSAPAGYKPPAEGRTITLKTDSTAHPTYTAAIRVSGTTVARSDSGTTTKPVAAAPQKPVMELVGKPAPQFAMTGTSGQPVGTAEFGRYPATVLNFVAPNCPFCKRQIPTIESVRAQYQERGVRFVNMGETLHGKVYTPQEAQATIDQFGSRLELAMDAGNKVGVQFKVTSFPVLVLVGKDGTVVDAYPGARADIPDKLKARLDELLRAEASGGGAKGKAGS